jgi:hypothetical protein
MTLLPAKPLTSLRVLRHIPARSKSSFWFAAVFLPFPLPADYNPVLGLQLILPPSSQYDPDPSPLPHSNFTPSASHSSELLSLSRLFPSFFSNIYEYELTFVIYF